MTPSRPKVKVFQYETNVGYFVKIENSYHSPVNNYIVNGKTGAELLIFGGYAKLESPVSTVQVRVPPTKKLVAFELKDKQLQSDKFPLVFTEWNFYEDDDETYYLLGNLSQELTVLYQPVFEVSQETFEDVPFEIVNLGSYEIEDPSNLKTRKIKLKGDSYRGSPDTILSDLSQIVKYEELVDIVTPPFAKEQAPCRLTSKQVYQITRQYLLENLDMKENVITSNYDFCFTVKKRVHTKPFMKTEFFSSGRKMKERKSTHTEVLVEVFEMTWSGYKGLGGYGGYTCAPEVTGDSVEDLYNNLSTMLETLITELNTKVSRCEHCNGTGHNVVKGNTFHNKLDCS